MIRRWLNVVVVLALMVSPLLAQSTPDEKVLLEKVEKALSGELERLRTELMGVVAAQLRADISVPPKGDVDRALAVVTEELLKDHATFLASDELEGRDSGFPGNDKATEYISGIMKKAGLKPVGDKDEAGNPTYYQYFKVSGRKTRNCLGLLEGTDPDLKREIIVLGAHHDHVGMGEQLDLRRLGRPQGNDKIWNGADDNASGTTCVLALVKAFGEGGLRTKRSILFMTFSGEEGGLLGSAYYTKHPIAPIEQHVYMLNLDMVGRNPEKPVEIQGVGSAEDGVIRKAVEAAVEKAGLKAKVLDDVEFLGGDSDHTSFRNKKVPFTFFFTGLHADYHRVTDHAEKLAYANMVKIAHTAARVLLAVGDGEKSPRFAPMRFSLPGVTPDRRKLGITPGEELTEKEYEALKLDKGQGAMRVENVSPDSVAEKCGLKEGDYVLAVGGKKLGRGTEGADLKSALKNVTPKKEVDVEVLRGTEKIVLKAVWDK